MNPAAQLEFRRVLYLDPTTVRRSIT